MNRPTRPDSLDLQQQPPPPPPPQPQQQQQQQQHTVKRSESNASIEGPPSSHGSSTLVSMGCPLASVSPESAYIAASAATGIVTSNHADFLQGEGITGVGRAPTILVTAPSLKLINQFLDFLLYSFLSTAKSTSLRALRPAVEQVLRSRLAKEAVAGADHELTSYLGGGDGEEDDFEELQGGAGVWDLEATWKKTRLRCMVYSSLGDLEEEDEAVYSGVDLEGSVGDQQYNPHSETLGVVSPPVAIWLTAVLEFVGEQTLLVAGHAAINRFTQKPHAEAAGSIDSCERPMVEELDAEKVALNPSLGRLWRQWRKRVRGRSSFSIPAFQRHERRASNSSRASASSFQPAENLPEARDTLQASAERVDKVQQAALEAGVDTTTTTIEEASEPASLSPTVGDTPQQAGRSNVEAKLLNSDDLMEKTRPQSLVILPWAAAESRFVPRSPTLSRPHSMPELTWREFPEPVAAAGAEELEEDESDKAESDPSTPLHERPAEPIRELDSLAKIDDQPGGEIDEDSNFVVIQAKLAEHAVPPETEDNATAPENDEGLAEEIGLARTSDVIVESPGSLSPRIRPTAENKAVNQLQQGELADKTPIATGNHPEGPSLARRSIESPRSIGYHSPDIAGEVKGSRSEVGDNAGDSCWPIATSPKGSRSEAYGLPTAIPVGNENSLHSQKESLESSKHPQHSQRSDKKLGQFPMLQPSSGSSVSISSERANGLRVWTPPTTPDKSRRSSSFSKAQRPIYTSGSTTSQSSAKFKSLVPWPVATAGQSKESDDESRSSLHSEKQSQRFADMDERERSFEELISRTDTIHCTITPDPIRRIEGFPHSKTQTADLADFLRNTGPDGMDPPRTLASSRPGSSRPGSRPSTGKAVAIVLKDPNAEDGISLAQLLRSPPSPSVLAAPPLSPRPIGKSNQTTTMHGASGPILRTGSPRVEGLPSALSPHGTISLPMVMKQYGSDSQSTHSRPKNRLIARDASGSSSSASTSALADFFRNTTPPVDGEQIPQRRISRSVAPFRNTMDSEQFDAARNPGNSQTESSTTNDLASFVVNPAPEDSYQSSFSSSTTLLRSNSKKTHDYGSTASSSMPAPVRKQHRHRDPYAIDFDDDTDIDGLDLVLPRQKEEESLIDFLRNVPPPPAPPTPPEDKMIQKKNSSVSLIGRFGRTSTRKNSVVSTAEGASPGASAKHIPLLADTDYMPHRYHAPSSGPYDYHRQTSDLRDPSSRGRTADRPPQGRIYQQQQPRGARAERDNTDSLADFLKYTPPPPPSQLSPTAVKEEGPSKFKISFGKKVKRSEVF